jgi:hypothetical protein
MAQAFVEGGPFMFLVLLVAIAVLAMTIVQFATLRKTDWSPLLWGLLAALLLTGVLGSVLGLSQAFGALANVSPEQRNALLAMALSMALSTTSLAVGCALPLSIMIGVASLLARRSWRRRLEAGRSAG